MPSHLYSAPVGWWSPPPLPTLRRQSRTAGRSLPACSAGMLKPFASIYSPFSTYRCSCSPHLLTPRAFATRTGLPAGEEEEAADVGEETEAYEKTLRLVETAMLASVSALSFFLSSSLGAENYFGCFLPLPIVISSMKWGLTVGRKTTVTATLLLLALSGPVKALTYMLMHGMVGLVMGSLWRLETSWFISIMLCTITRALGACGYVLVSSFLIRENILALITVNIHATLTYALTATGVNAIPSMETIYLIFGVLLLLNCGFFIFLLHILYAIFLTKLGMRASLRLPRWVDKAI